MAATDLPPYKPQKPGRKPIPARCKYCDVEFASTRAARDHQWGDECPKKPKTATRGRPSKTAICPYCKSEIPSVRKMQAHRKTCIFKPRKKARKLAARKGATTKRKTTKP